MQESREGGLKVKRPYGVALAVFLAGIFVNALIYLMARDMERRSFDHAFEAEAGIRAQLVIRRLDRTLLAAESLKQMAEISPPADQNSFKNLTIPLIERFGWVRSFAWTPAVAGKDRSSFLESVRLENPGFDIIEYGEQGEKVPARARDFYYPILYSEPKTEKTAKVLGFDAGSTAVMLEALDRARTSGRGAATGSLALTNGDESSGFIVAEPVYEKEISFGGSRNIRGFVILEIDTDRLCREALENTHPIGLPFDILDYSAHGERRLVYNWVPRLQGIPSWRDIFYPPAPVREERFSFAGREWGISVWPNQGFMDSHYSLIYCLLLPGGLIPAFLLAAFAYNMRLRRDISEAGRKALWESEERVRLAVTSAKLGLFDLDLCSGTAKVSEEYLTMLGYEPGEIEPTLEWWSGSIHPDDRESALSVLESLAGGKFDSYQIEYRFRTKSAGWKWLQSSGKVVGYGENAKPVRMTGVHADITEKKTAEIAREKMLEDLRNALDNVKTLEGLLPICSACKKIRDDTGYWVQVESYIQKKTGAEFTHGICPDCVKELYPELSED